MRNLVTHTSYSRVTFSTPLISGTHMNKLKAAGAICYLQDGKDTLFLVLRSSKNGEWGPPKGHAEPFESELETATRELYEEAGLRSVRFLPGFRETTAYSVIKKKETFEKEAIYFLCEMPNDEVTISSEHSEYHFATLDELDVILAHESMKEIFRKALQYIKTQHPKQ